MQPADVQYLDSVEFDLAALALPITEIELTLIDQCGLCYPAQWDAVTTDGREIYVRWRDGKLSVAQDTLDAEGEMCSIPIFLRRLDWPPVMTTEAMLMHTGLRMAS